MTRPRRASHFMEPEGSLPGSQGPAIRPCAWLVDVSPEFPTLIS